MAMGDTKSSIMSINDSSSARQSKDSGLVQRGNINLHNRPVVDNPKTGKKSTVYSMGIGIENGREALIPRVSDSGKILSKSEAIEQFKKTKQHLGIYDSRQSAERAAVELHKSQEKEYLKK